MTRRCSMILLMVIAGIFLTSPGSALAQTPRATADGFVGYAGFVDDATIDHSVWGAAARWYVLPRVAIGPELVYFNGPRDEHDLVITGNVTFDVLARPRITPFLVAGGGIFRHSETFGTQTFTSSEGSFTAGGGVRVPIGARLYIAPEVRFGWELHYRVSLALGWRSGD